MAQQPLVGQDLPIIESSRSHSDIPQSVGLLWTSDQRDQPDAQTSDNTQHSQQTLMPPEGLEPAIPTSERPQTDVLGRAATEIGYFCFKLSIMFHRGKHTVVRRGGGGGVFGAGETEIFVER